MRKCMYSIDELKKFLVNFYNISGIIVGIHDFEDNYAAIQGNSDKKTFCRFCSENSSLYEYKCFENDNSNFEKINKERKAIIYKCHMGFTEAMIPVIINNEIVCIIFMGQINSNKHSDYDFNDKVKRLVNIDPAIFERITIDNLHEAYMKTTYCDIEVFKSYIDIAKLCTISIYNSHWIKYRTISVYEAFTQYVTDNIYNSLSIKEMAVMLNISTSHLSRIIKLNSGMSYIEYINRQKIEYAKKSISDAENSIKNIALSVGINDANYFSRLFKKYTGMTCSEYRNNIR